MNLTKKQIEIISKIEHLLGHKLDVSAINRKTIAVRIDHRFHTCSDLYVKIDGICRKYKLGRVEPNGIYSMGIIISAEYSY